MLLVVAALALASCTTADGSDDADDADDATAASEGTEEVDTEEVDGFRFHGPSEDALLGAEDLAELAFTVAADGADEAELAGLVVLLGDQDVTADIEVAGGTLTYAPAGLPDGAHTVTVAEAPDDWNQVESDVAATDDAAADDADDATDDADTPHLDVAELDTLHTWRFEVKAEPPVIELTSPGGAVIGDEPVTVAGTTDPGAEVTVNDTTVTADDQGSFEVELDGDTDELTILAVDRAGNTAEHAQAFARVPSRVELDEYRAVHATFWAWATAELREPMLEMLDEGRINAVQLDLKDEGGHIGYDSEVALANDIGADIGPLDLEQAVANLHADDVPVIGRIVAFADPALAEWAWDNDRRDMVIQVTDGSDYYRGSYAGFSNYTHADVIAYNLDIAEEAAKAGVDHILWDYIRRPEGQSQYTVPGLETTPEEAIVEFTRQADERLAPYGVTHGASVYGIAADRPEQIGQDIPGMAEHLDYVAPMIYPSHWGPGEYGVSEPNRQPYDIIRATLEVWDEAIEGTDTRVIPWLEDTSYRAWDRPFQIAEQIRATKDHEVNEWLMWNPGSRYTPAAYQRLD